MVLMEIPVDIRPLGIYLSRRKQKTLLVGRLFPPLDEDRHVSSPARESVNAALVNPPVWAICRATSKDFVQKNLGKFVATLGSCGIMEK